MFAARIRKHILSKMNNLRLGCSFMPRLSKTHHHSEVHSATTTDPVFAVAIVSTLKKRQRTWVPILRFFSEMRHIPCLISWGHQFFRPFGPEEASVRVEAKGGSFKKGECEAIWSQDTHHIFKCCRSKFLPQFTFCPHCESSDSGCHP